MKILALLIFAGANCALAQTPVTVPLMAAPPLLPAALLAPDDYYRINSTAHGLAGLEARSQRGSASWQTAPEWITYQTWINGRWSYIQDVRIGAMQTFGASALAPLQSASSSVFYPFSGPDFLYVNAFFPHSRYLLMAGLEPIGTIPDLTALKQQGRLDPYLQNVKTSLYTSLAASFFKTKDMKTDFNAQLVDGVLPDLVTFIAHAGGTIDSLQYVSLDYDGALHAHAPAGADGVQIIFFQRDRNVPRVLLYFQADLADDGQKANPGFVHLMHRLGPGVTYLKAASYLLHEDYFSTVRDAILNDSLAVVEDDSGIPLRDFKPAQWQVTGYGKYTGPLELFKQYYQPDLAQLFAAHPASPLAFGSGYKFVPADSSLLVARKK